MYSLISSVPRAVSLSTGRNISSEAVVEPFDGAWVCGEKRRPGHGQHGARKGARAGWAVTGREENPRPSHDAGAHTGGGVGWRRAATGDRRTSQEKRGRARSVCRRKVRDRANQTRLAVAPFGIWQSLVIACRSLRGKSARLPAMEL